MDEQEFLAKPHHLLRELLRNFDELQSVCKSNGSFAIEHKLGDVEVFISLAQVESARRCILKGEGRVTLLPEWRRAVVCNVLKDMTQKESGEVLGGTKPVIIGQHVEAACESLARSYFPEWYEETV